MDADEKTRRAASFGQVADMYADHRPGYPAEVAAWLVGTKPARVLELGAGTGKLTAVLVALGHDVIATDPSSDMLAHLRTAAPRARCALARAEDIPLPSSSVDVVVAGQSFHWFDAERALPEIARVLRPGGTLALAWNTGDGKVPWVRKLFTLARNHLQSDLEDPFDDHDVFTLAEQRSFRHWQTFRKPDVLGFIASQSGLAVLTPTERDKILGEAASLYDGYGRGPDGLRMPWLTLCYRGRVAGHATPERPPSQWREDPDAGLFIDFD